MINIDECLTAAQKKAWQRDLRNYVEDELKSAARDIVKEYSQAYLKANTKEIKELVESELSSLMPKVLKKISADLMERLTYKMRHY